MADTVPREDSPINESMFFVRSSAELSDIAISLYKAMLLKVEPSSSSQTAAEMVCLRACEVQPQLSGDRAGGHAFVQHCLHNISVPRLFAKEICTPKPPQLSYTETFHLSSARHTLQGFWMDPQ